MMKRIAIYARKSVESDRGESINIQIEKCRDYIKLINKDGEDLSINEYKDEGYSGSNVYRPAFQRLLRDIENNEIDMIICYKLDRITRSTVDFADINKRLEKHKVNFASVTERFDTSTPMGRAMLGIIIVFAQLEREQISERITDNMFSLAKTERWISGKAPLGYKLDRFDSGGKKQTRLIVDEARAPHVQMIFDQYILLGSITKLETFLLQNHIKSQNGKNMTNSQLALILKNPSYVKADERVKDFYVSQGAEFYGEVNGLCGLMSYAKTKTFLSDKGKQNSTKNTPDKWIISVGTHTGIIEADKWLEAQRILKENHDKFPRIQRSHTALVSGIIRCAECSSPMKVEYGRKNKDGSKGYYYVCKLRDKSRNTHCTNKNARADFVDEAIINELKSKYAEQDRFLSALKDEIQHGKQEITHNPVELIEVEIEKKNKQITRLVERVSKTKTDEVALELENQIDELIKEIQQLSSELRAKSEMKESIHQNQSFLEFVEELLNKLGVIDTLGLEEQREFINILIKQITWDSKTDTLFIRYITDSDDNNGGGGNGGSDDGGGNDSQDYDSYNDGIAALESAITGKSEMSYFHSSFCCLVSLVNRFLVAFQLALRFPDSHGRYLVVFKLGRYVVNGLRNASYDFLGLPFHAPSVKFEPKSTCRLPVNNLGQLPNLVFQLLHVYFYRWRYLYFIICHVITP